MNIPWQLCRTIGPLLSQRFPFASAKAQPRGYLKTNHGILFLMYCYSNAISVCCACILIVFNIVHRKMRKRPRDIMKKSWNFVWVLEISDIPADIRVALCTEISTMKTPQHWRTSRVYVILVFAILMLFDVMTSFCDITRRHGHHGHHGPAYPTVTVIMLWHHVTSIDVTWATWRHVMWHDVTD